jgi:hypothetical protein
MYARHDTNPEPEHPGPGRAVTESGAVVLEGVAGRRERTLHELRVRREEAEIAEIEARTAHQQALTAALPAQAETERLQAQAEADAAAAALIRAAEPTTKTSRLDRVIASGS